MKTFKNIVVATDFSDSAANAYQYAQNLAELFDANLTVVHVFDIPVKTAVSDYTITMPTISELEQSAKERLANFIEMESDDDVDSITIYNTKVKAEALLGLPAQTLIERSLKHGTDLMILGTVGEHGWLDKAFGSVAVKVMEKAHCPVLLVPKNAVYNGIRNTLYASGQESASRNAINMALDFAHLFNSTLHFVHVDAIFEADKQKANSTIKHVLAQRATNIPLHIKNITAETVSDGINAYCQKNSIDLIMAVTHHRSFWQDFIHYSVTRELAWQTNMPLICFHSDDDL